MVSSSDDRLAALAGKQSTRVPPPKRNFARLLFPALLIVAILGLFFLVARDRLQPATPVTTAAVVTKAVGGTAEQQPASVSVQAPGWVEPAPYPTYVGALASGIIDQLLVLEGDPVTANQPVAQLIRDDAELAVQRAAATLADRRAELAAAEANWQHPTELDRQIKVAAARIVELDAGIDEVNAVVKQKLAQQSEAQQVLTRRNNADPGTIPVLDVERARFQLAARDADLEATKQQIPTLRATRERLQAELAAHKENRELRIADRHRLDAAKAAVQLAETALAEAKLRLERMTVRAPVAGVVMTRLKAPGSKVMLDMDSPHSAHVVHLYDPASLQVRVDVPLADAANVGVGQQAIVVVDVLPDVEFTGSVTRFVHQADLSKNTVQVKVAIEAPSPLLKPEMLARVKFLAQASPEQEAGNSDKMTVLVPANALIEVTADAAAVWLVTADGKHVQRRELKIGPSYRDDWRVVRDGLNPGDVVVLQPPADLSNNQRVAATTGAP